VDSLFALVNILIAFLYLKCASLISTSPSLFASTEIRPVSTVQQDHPVKFKSVLAVISYCPKTDLRHITPMDSAPRLGVHNCHDRIKVMKLMKHVEAGLFLFATTASGLALADFPNTMPVELLTNSIASESSRSIFPTEDYAHIDQYQVWQKTNQPSSISLPHTAGVPKIKLLIQHPRGFLRVAVSGL